MASTAAEKGKHESIEINDEQMKIPSSNVPLGWNGEPVPHWIRMLHSQSDETTVPGQEIAPGAYVNRRCDDTFQQFPCEICGNHWYRGRQAFEQHFRMWRHRHGLGAIGIPHGTFLKDITSVEEAMTLWGKIKAHRRKTNWKPDHKQVFVNAYGDLCNMTTSIELE